jgi:hypothetical protein
MITLLSAEGSQQNLILGQEVAHPRGGLNQRAGPHGMALLVQLRCLDDRISPLDYGEFRDPDVQLMAR